MPYFRVVSVSITDIGTLGGTGAVANDINNAGVIVGTSRTSLDDNHAFLYRAGVMFDISPPGHRYSSARAISAYDEVAANFSADMSRWHAYRWKAGVSYPLNDNDPSGAPGFSMAYGISITGLIAGERWSLSTATPAPSIRGHAATLWTSNTNYLTLSRTSPTRVVNSYARDVSIRREVAGYDGFDSTARRWTLIPSGGFTSTAAPLPAPSASYSLPRFEGTNAKGNFVGAVGCCTGVPGANRRALFWDGASAFSTDLGLLSGGTYTEADDINDERFIAGYGDRRVAPAAAYETGFLYHTDFGFHVLPVLSTTYYKCRAQALNERKATGEIQLVGGCVSASDGFRAVRWDVRVERVTP